MNNIDNDYFSQNKTDSELDLALKESLEIHTLDYNDPKNKEKLESYAKKVYGKEWEMQKNYENSIQKIQSLLDTIENKALDVFELLNKNYDANEDILEKINEYFDYFTSMSNFDSNEEIETLFFHIDEYEELFRSYLDSFCDDIFLGEHLKEELISKASQLSYLNLYLLILKWLITNDSMCLNSIFDILDEEYSDSFIYPVDDKKYWIDRYSSLNQLNVDNRIKKYCIFYDYFYNCYSEYVKIYISDEHHTPNIDIFSTDVIWATNYLEDNIDKLNNQLIDRVDSVIEKKATRDTVKELIKRQLNKYGLKSIDGISEELKEKMYTDFNNNFISTFIQKYEEQSETKRELINKLRKINLYSVDDYYKVTRNLSISQKKETGKFATIVIENNLEIINLMRIISNELSKENNDYTIIYNQLTTLLENSSRLIYGSFSKYILDSKVENLEKDTQRYVSERINIMYVLLLTHIVNGSIDNILQCKSMLLPYVHSDNIIVQQNF